MSAQAGREAVGMGSWTRLRGWAARRSRQLLRIVLAFAVVLVCGAAGALIWRAASLFGLPDVGDPFDVAAVDDAGVSADHDAFVFLERASDRLRPRPQLSQTAANAGPVVDWSKADPELRRWVEANREVMELFRQGAAQPDGNAHPGKDETVFSSRWVRIRPFDWLALLEGSRLEERGEMAGAWAWYRALLEMRAHIMRRGTLFERFITERDVHWLQDRVAAWAADPRTDARILRRALDDANRIRPRPEWDASSLKIEYLLEMRELDRPVGPLTTGYDDNLSYRVGGEALPPNLAQQLHAARRFLLNEPERSRRVLRLIYANWLSHIDDPAEGHRRPAVRASFRNGQTTSVLLYAFGPTAPTQARTLAPRDLAAWLLKAHDAKLLLGQWPLPSISLRERRQHRALMVLLAEQLYRRERGASPPSEEALVGTYLERLPDDGPADGADGSTPTVTEAGIAIANGQPTLGGKR